MSPELDPEKVVDLPLEPVRRGPEGLHAVHLEGGERELALDAEGPTMRHGPELVDDLEWATAPEVHGRHIGEEVVVLARLALQPRQDLAVPRRIDEHDVLVTRGDLTELHTLVQRFLGSANGLASVCMCPSVSSRSITSGARSMNRRDVK